MAIIGNRKQLMSLLLLCVITSGVVIPPPWVEAQVTCPGLINTLLPCANYILNGGTIPATCCQALKTVEDGLKTKQDRQDACQCMKELIDKTTPEQLKRAQELPAYCHLPLPFPISRSVDCSSIPKRI
ncbi:PREDICTED: non-specific lipid-transfer protein 1-like [Ipomoea nil]|uniref:non-specific lipid-transfer protein 1-like n=1 Tax=Ipomoea nil TaxID=35883 RepID=UPI000901B667|nr:PREDICTED: non-specific lipid-transfer protein 1-like [Ipomoea nil]